MKKILGLFLIGAALLLNCNNAFSATVDVSYGYSGVPGDYLLDFTVTNNMPASYSQKLYFWGVDLANAPAQGIPGSWSDYNTMWNNHSSLGVGSSIDYPSNWLLNNYTWELHPVVRCQGLQYIPVLSRKIFIILLSFTPAATIHITGRMHFIQVLTLVLKG